MRGLILFLLMLGLAPAAPQNSGVIEGLVTRFGTTEGLASVRITITREGQEELASEPDAITDATGHFIIRNAAPGAYTIRAARPGYLTPFQNGTVVQDGGSSKKISVELARPTMVSLALSPGSALAGRVTDPLGRPADGATVEATQVLPDGTTKIRRTAGADDRGQFRIWGLEPGKYRLSLEYRRGGIGNVIDLGGGTFTSVPTPLFAPEARLSKWEKA
jgi:Carboxypeptidase regulatory-like domain